jgi:hypothetical protein
MARSQDRQIHLDKQREEERIVRPAERVAKGTQALIMRLTQPRTVAIVAVAAVALCLAVGGSMIDWPTGHYL